MDTSKTAIGKEFAQTFRSLKFRDFRIYFFGYLISLCGTWMQGVALAWLIYRMTHSAVWLGVIEAANMLPMLLFGLTAGGLADRVNRKRVLIITQALSMTQAIVLAALTITNRLEIWQAVALSAFVGTCMAFEVPSRQAFMVELVDREHLVNAISLNSSLFNAARVIGPAIAGVLVAAAGEAVCFSINAVSYIAALGALFLISAKGDRHALDSDKKNVNVRDALDFVLKKPHVRRLLILALILSLFGLQYSVLMPIIASEILHGQVGTLGALRAGAGFGSFCAALFLASRASGDFLKRAVGLAGMLFGTTLLLFSMSTNFWLSEFLVVIVGFAMTSQLSGGHSLIQLAVTDELRGRVMSIYMTILMGLGPIGSFAVGVCAQKWGAQPTITVCAAFTLIAAIFYVLADDKERKRLV